MATKTMVRSQVRGFAVVWTAITIIIGIATFFAIYLAYETEAANDEGSTALTQPPTVEAAAVVPTTDATAVPTRDTPPTATDAPPPTATTVPTEPVEVTEEAPVAVEEDVPVDADADDASDEAESVEEDMNDDNASMEDDDAANEAENAEQPVEEVAADPVEETEAEEVAAVAEETEEPEEDLPPIAQTDFLVGIQVQYSLDLNPDTQRLWMNDVGGLGLNTFKQQIRWEEIEVAPGEYNWDKLDLVMPIAEEYGYNVIGSVVAAPDWAREPGADLSQDGPPENLEDFAVFLEAMLERYPGQFFALEIWNEPNLEREWASPNGLSASRVVDLNQIAYDTIKNIDPGIIVISGALSPTGGDGGVRAQDDFVFMDEMIAAGLLNYTDCVGAHHNGINVPPYYEWDEIPNDPNAQYRGPFDNPHHSWSFRSTLSTYATKISVANGDQRLCVTEFGWPTVEDMDGYPEGFGFAADNTLEEQAQWTADALSWMEETGDIWIATIWNLNYGPQAGWSTESDNTPYSFIGPDFVKRPVYAAVAEWVANR